MAHPCGADIGVSGCALPDCLATMGFTSERNPSINLLKIFYNDLHRSHRRSNFLAVLVTLVGSAFQLSDGFLTCFWASPVSSWLEPATKHQVMLHYEITSQSYQDYADLLGVSLYRAAAIYTCVVCFSDGGIIEHFGSL
jgi:hypothetical protein